MEGAVVLSNHFTGWHSGRRAFGQRRYCAQFDAFHMAGRDRGDFDPLRVVRVEKSMLVLNAATGEAELRHRDI